MTTTTLLCVALAAAMTQVESNPDLARSVRAEAIYVREVQDQAWRIRIVGTLPRAPGMFAVVLNEAGERIHAGEAPSGTYTAEQPFVIEIPADGSAQQYVIHFVGQQDNHTGIEMPMTDLPFEVYGGTWFAVGDARTSKQSRQIALRVPPESSQVMLTAHGEFRIAAEDGSLSKDSKTDGIPRGDERRYFKNGAELPLSLEPGKTYWIDPYEARYVGARERVYLTFDPQRWFAPTLTWELTATKWWKGLGR